MAELKLGIYRHYKGPLYQVLGLAHDANADERTVVVYIGLQLDRAHLGPRLAVRTLNDFQAIVCTNEGCLHYGKYIGSSEGLKVMDVIPSHPLPGHIGLLRFTYLGQELEEEMLDG